MRNYQRTITYVCSTCMKTWTATDQVPLDLMGEERQPSRWSSTRWRGRRWRGDRSINQRPLDIQDSRYRPSRGARRITAATTRPPSSR